MIIGITEERDSFMNNGLLLTSNKEMGSKELRHKKRNDLVSDRTDDCEEEKRSSLWRRYSKSI